MAGSVRKWLVASLVCAAAIPIMAAAKPHKAAHERIIAGQPPMGWNSWDAYGLAVTETDFRANVDVLAKQLKPFGWNYAVIDEGWFLKNPLDRPTPEKLVYVIDENGRYIPDPVRFPSALENGKNTGFRAIGDAIHAQGLKFGIHIGARHSARIL